MAEKWNIILLKNSLGGGREHTFVKCRSCGLTVNKTVYEMTEAEWEGEVNSSHREYQGTDDAPGDPNWIPRLKTQARMFAQLFEIGFLSADDNCIDFGCGDGKLSDYTDDEYRNICGKRPEKNLINKYDEFMNPNGDDGYLSKTDVDGAKFDLVISCSVFEHLIGMDNVQKVLSKVADNGIMAVQTLVVEEVPQDPEWFYLHIAHCTIWSNKAMSALYDKQGYQGCAYNVEARMWFFFNSKERFENLKKVAGKVDGTWVFSDKFVDYWKNKPYRENSDRNDPSIDSVRG